MKKYFAFCMLCALMLGTVVLSGCKKNGKDEPSTLISDKEKPAWVAPSDFDMTSSMTAVIRVDLSLTYPKLIKDAARSIGEGDLLAAFAGDQCIGVTSPEEGLFYLFITTPTKDDAPISLHYYSSILKNLFVSDETFVFDNDQRLGSYSEPYTPHFHL